MRLIDADALSEKLCGTTIFIKDGEVFQRMINDAPTIDAVEVVRCKDCRHWHPEDGDCEEMAKLTGALDYCSFGLSKEGEDE